MSRDICNKEIAINGEKISGIARALSFDICQVNKTKVV